MGETPEAHCEPAVQKSDGNPASRVHDPLIPERELFDLARHPDAKVRLAVASRAPLPGCVESLLVQDGNLDVVRALAKNPAVSNYAIANLPRMLSWQDNGRLYRERNLPHFFWDVMLLYLAASVFVGFTVAIVLLHFLFDGAYTPAIAPYWLGSSVLYFPLLFRRLKNYPKPRGWGAVPPRQTP